MKPLLSSAAALILAGAAISHAQTLGDVARQEEARRKTVKAPAKVYTNDNIRPATPPSAAPAPEASTPAAVPPSPSGAPTPAAPGQAPAADPKADEATWRQRMTALRDNLSRAQTFQEALQSRINALSTDFVNRDDPAQRGQIAGDRQKALAELERVKSEIQQTQKAITDLQEEARKAGVPAGWVR